MISANLVQTAIEQMRDLTPVLVPPMKSRLEAEPGILFLTFPDPGRLTRRHVLNPLAAAIYELIDGQRTIGQIVVTLRAHFADEDPAVVTYDALHLIRSFERKGLIAPLGPPPADVDHSP